MSDEDVARLFHEAYERLAPSFGYETRKASAVPWPDVPENNRRLMTAVVGEVRAALRGAVPEAGNHLDTECRDGSCHFAVVRHTHDIAGDGVYAWEVPEAGSREGLDLNAIATRINAFHKWRVVDQHGWTGTIGIGHMEQAQYDRNVLLREVIRLRRALGDSRDARPDFGALVDFLENAP